MNTHRCLFCYQELQEENMDFHPACSRKIFGKPAPPVLPYTAEQMWELASQVIRSRTTVTGVQPKISLNIERSTANEQAGRFTIVGLWGNFILKPPTVMYPTAPEVEDLTMHLARLSKITTVPHALIRLQSGELAYITKRVDRTRTGKLHMEDMCQLTEKLTEHKYRGSYEQIGKAIIRYSVNPGLDILNFFEQVLFSFLTGNADMHLKNFSLLHTPELGYTLCPAYDMVATALLVAGDDEELALTLNGKKKKLKQKDFLTAMAKFNLKGKSVENLFRKFVAALPTWIAFIRISFLPEEMKEQFIQLITQRFKQLEI